MPKAGGMAAEEAADKDEPADEPAMPCPRRKEPPSETRTQHFWRQMRLGVTTAQSISELLKLALLLLVLVPGSVEDERVLHLGVRRE